MRPYLVSSLVSKRDATTWAAESITHGHRATVLMANSQPEAIGIHLEASTPAGWAIDSVDAMPLSDAMIANIKALPDPEQDNHSPE